MSKKAIFLAWTFFIFYLPPVIGISSIKIIGVISWIYIALNFRRLKHNFQFTKLVSIFIIALSVCVYIVCVEVFNIGVINSAVAVPIYLTIFAFPAAIAYVIKIDKMKLTVSSIAKYMIYAGTIQGVISILCLASYSIQNIFVRKLYYIMEPSVVDYWRTMRLYGWSTGMTYAMPILSATIGLIALLYAIRINIKYLVLVPIIWASGILNARTSMVVILIGVISIVISTNILDKKQSRVIPILGGIGILFIIAVLSVSTFIDNDNLARWMKDGVSETFNFLRGRNIGYFASIGIPSNTLEFPPNLLFGKGYVGTRSDVGYIRDMWMGGLLYCGSLVALLVYWINKVYRKVKVKSKTLAKGIVFYFVAVILSTNVKGQIVSGNEFMIFFLVFIICMIYYKKGDSYEN